MHIYNDRKEPGDRNVGDAQLLCDRHVQSALQNFEKELSQNRGEASKLRSKPKVPRGRKKKQFEREITRAWSLVNAWLVRTAATIPHCV